MIHCCVGVIQNENDEFLIAQRRLNDSFGGYWEFPGGKQEDGESQEECVIREINEEVGLNIQPERFIMTIRNPYKDKEISLHFYLCRVENQIPQAHECQDVRWVGVKQLKDYLFPPANEKVISYLLESNSIH